MKRPFCLLILLAVFVACQKEKFPEMKQLQGDWTEITDNAFKNKLRFENETMYFTKSNTIDTLIFRLANKEEKMFLRLKNYNSETETEHKIRINKKRDELTVWNLFITYSFETETTFKKE